MVDYTKEEKYGIIKESCSKFYPGAKVKILACIESFDDFYIVKSVEGQLEYMVKAEDVEIVDADDTALI